MTPVEPFFRTAGDGCGVLCFHANASSSNQWRGLMERLSGDYRVFAPDSYGAGKTPHWGGGRLLTLADEVDLIEPLLLRARPPLVLVGHSYGGAIALLAALRHPEKVRALALYEPTLFSLLDAESPPPNAADGIRSTVTTAIRALEANDPSAAAECFIDYWMEPGAWQQIPKERRPAILASIVNIPHWAHALTRDPTPLDAFRRLDMPVLYMTGERSPASSLAVARLLAGALPDVRRVDFAGLGHMGPVTDPEPVNDEIERFLASLPHH